jgi:integrase/recombinase XerD
MSATASPTFAPVLQRFFVERLGQQRNASPHTIASYRDTFRLLLPFAAARLRRPPSAFALTDLDAPLLLAFLDHLEGTRHNSIRTRNARLAALRSFMRFAGFHEPRALPVVQRVLAIPSKRCHQLVLGYLSREELNAVVAAPDPATWSGQRDRVMFATFYNTGARIAEIIAITVSDLHLGSTATVHLRGKGRKERTVPLWKTTATDLRAWLPRITSAPAAPLFPNRGQFPLTRSGVEARLRRAVRTATITCPTLRGRHISPHTFRHTTAMHLLQAGVDLAVIALWLGHESPDTTHRYLEADLAMKERALQRLPPPLRSARRFRAPDGLLQFLDTL